MTKGILVIGGPNGAGKTTAAKELLPSRLSVSEFLNADEIARGLSPFNPDHAAISAGRFMLARMQTLVAQNTSFAFETTCAGLSQLRLLNVCKANDWQVALIFLWLPSPDEAIRRVARRVLQGGHDIPEHVIVRRYWAGLRNLHEHYLPLADVAIIYDNSDDGRRLVAERVPGAELRIHDTVRWSKMSC
jgi:predicted ABC-type ATPase